MSSSDLDDVGEFMRLLLQGFMEGSQSRKKDSMGLEHCCDVHNCREAVIAGLTAIDMVVGMYSLSSDLTSHKLNGSVGNDLVSVHVGLSS